MQSIIDFLSSQIWQGVQGVIAIVALIVSLTNPRKWLLSRQNTKWLVNVPWAWFLIAGGFTMGISMGIKYENTYLGLFVASIVTAVGMGIQWLQSSLLLSRFRETYEHLTYLYNNLLKSINRLQHSEFTLSDWVVSHTVLPNGTGVLKEEVTIIPVAEPVFYYYVRYGDINFSNQKEIKLSVVNTSDETPLPCFEVARTEDSITYMVVLDPPSIVSKPKRISITCERKGFWDELIKHGQDESSLNAQYKANSIKIELIAPPSSKWKALHPAPVTGDIAIAPVGNLSRATWEIINPSIREYNYRVFLDGMS